MVIPRNCYDDRLPVKLVCLEKTLTKQSMKNECDINVIMKKYEKSGLISHVNSFEGFYGDVSALPDYHGAFEVVRLAGESFNSLPAALRTRFDNDAEKYLEFVMNPANREEMIKLGMIVPAEPVESAVASPA